MAASRPQQLRAFLLGTAAACAAAGSALAADAPPAQGTATVQELVVTARKRAERLVDVPAPVSAVSTEELTRQGAVKFSDYLTTVPGANFSSSRSGATFLILRGVTTGANVNPTVATYIDDAPFGSSTIFALGSVLTPDLDPVDIDHIEILRGPQGTLYGANTIGGIIKFVTAKPDTNHFSGRLEASDTSILDHGSGLGLRGQVNLPLVSDRLAVRISGYDREDPGFISDPNRGLTDLNTTRVIGGRIDALLRASDNLSFRLSATAHDFKSNGTSNMDIVQTQQGGPLGTHGELGGPTYGDLEQFRYLPEPVDMKYRLYNATATWDLGGAQLISSTSYSTENGITVEDLTPAYLPALAPLFGPRFGATLQRDIHQTKATQELRLSSSGERRIDWQAGAYFTHEGSTADDTVPTFDNVTGEPTVLPELFHAVLISRYTEYSAFGDIDFHFTPAFDVLVGGRYSYDRQHYRQPSSGLLYGPPSEPISESHEDAFTYLINPRYKLGPDSMVYGRIASGYRPGGPNAVPPGVLGFPLSFGPDSLVNYELGWKSELFDRRLSIDVSAFYIQWDKVQLQENFGGYTANGNGGKASSKGFEGQASWRPVDGLTLSGNLTYTDAKIETDTPTTGAFEGDHLPLVPRWSFGLSAEYAWSLGPDWDAYVGATYRNIGDRPNVFTPFLPTSGYHVTLPGYDTVDLRAGVAHGPWALTGFVRNLTDERGITSAGTTTLVNQSPAWTASVITPRTVGVSISRTF